MIKKEIAGPPVFSPRSLFSCYLAAWLPGFMASGIQMPVWFEGLSFSCSADGGGLLRGDSRRDAILKITELSPVPTANAD